MSPQQMAPVSHEPCWRRGQKSTGKIRWSIPELGGLKPSTVLPRRIVPLKLQENLLGRAVIH